MNSHYWPRPILIGGVWMCPQCLLIAVAHAWAEAARDHAGPQLRVYVRILAEAHWALLNNMTDEERQHYAQALVEHSQDASNKCRYANVHIGGHVVDIPADGGADNVPY